MRSVRLLRNITIMSKYFFFYSGSQSILNYFWPIFRLLSPIFVGYITFGQILEQNSGSIPYKYWFLSGGGVWIILNSSLNTGLILFNSKNRRRNFQIANKNVAFITSSILTPYLLIGFIMTVIPYILLNDFAISLKTLFRFSLVVLIFAGLTVLATAIALIVGILNALLRDTRNIVGFLSQILLFASPVFYFPRIPNSSLEILWQTINPMNPILDVIRWLVCKTSINEVATDAIYCSALLILSTIFVIKSTKIVDRLNFALEQSKFDINEESLD